MTWFTEWLNYCYVHWMCTTDTMLAGYHYMFFLFPFPQIFHVQLLSGPQWYEPQVDTAGEEFLDALMCDFKWTRANVMYMREKTPIKEGATLPGKSHHYFFETHSNSDKGHESNQTLRRGQEGKSVCTWVCVMWLAASLVFLCVFVCVFVCFCREPRACPGIFL